MIAGTGLVLASVIVVVILAGSGALPGTPEEPLPVTREEVTIGMEPNQVNSLILIAEDRGYFTANGLNVTIRPYPSGAAAVEGMMDGGSDIATATEFVLVGQALKGAPVGTFASIDRFQHIHVLGRRDRRIVNISDLRGMRIGVPRKTAGEFYLGRFLALHGMGMQDILPVNVPPQESVGMIANGSVDAIVAWQPNVRNIRSRLGDGVADWPAQSGQPAYCIVIAHDAWIQSHPGTAERVVKAIGQAETFAAGDPAGAREIVRQRLNYDTPFMEEIWSEHQFALTLDQSLVTAMEDEARWMMANNVTNATTMPNFDRFISAGALEKVKPGSVNIIAGRSRP